ncbi:unnamed protein product [Ixodes pacificus]
MYSVYVGASLNCTPAQSSCPTTASRNTASSARGAHSFRLAASTAGRMGSPLRTSPPGGGPASSVRCEWTEAVSPASGGPSYADAGSSSPTSLQEYPPSVRTWCGRCASSGSRKRKVWCRPKRTRAPCCRMVVSYTRHPSR